MKVKLFALAFLLSGVVLSASVNSVAADWEQPSTTFDGGQK
jgi:hypothetical protein